jgi:serine/threonine protein phosphatase PrpC
MGPPVAPTPPESYVGAVSSPTNEQIRMLAVTEHAALTDVGLAREHNEDSYFVRPPLFVVADGMGGANAGEVASGLVVETMEKELDEGDMPGALGAAIEDANARIHAMAQEDRSLAGMGTTTTAGWFGGATLTLAHVGDSRCYRFRAEKLEQLSEDHSLVGGLVRLGKLTPQEAAEHPQRSVILRAVGVEPTVEVDLTEHEMEDGDVYLICSDGLDSMVRDEVIEEALRMCADLDDAAQMLIDLANTAGGHDNITVLLVRVARGRMSDS